jgi:hypothetical protein
MRNDCTIAEDNGVDPLLRRYSWGLTHGYYASMGGFVLQVDAVDSSEDDLLPASYNGRVTLTPAGVAFLMEHDPSLIPDISEESIMDHSKADGFAKLLQLVQVAWFFFNCLARRIAGLPLSLLEVSTLAHTVCMLVTYVLWWKKPLDIGEPFVIQGGNTRKICALLLYLSADRAFSKHILGGFYIRSGYYTRPHSSVFQQLALDAAARYGLGELQQGSRWELVVPQIDLQFWPFSANASGGGGQHGNAIYAGIAAALLCALYGGIHLTPWNNIFPTPTEQTLWRTAAIVVTSTGMCEGIIIILGVMINQMPSESLIKKLKFFKVPILMLSRGIFGLYCWASLFLMVESLRQLAYLPPQVHQLPSWPNYWPHFA